jgi:hypothetical protein
MVRALILTLTLFCWYCWHLLSQQPPSALLLLLLLLLVVVVMVVVEMPVPWREQA